MDYEKIKELVIKEKWTSTEGKYGDDYRSLSIQIDNFVKHLKNEDSPIQWLPLHLMTEYEIADFVCVYLERSAENRLILNNMMKQGIKYNYSDFIVRNPKLEKEMELIFEVTPELKSYNYLKIIEVIEEINIVLVGSQYEGYRSTANKLLHYIDLILAEINDESGLFKQIGLSMRNTDYIEQYIAVCERILYGSIFYFIIENSNITDKVDVLSRFYSFLEKAEETILEEVDKAKENYKRDREFHKQYYKADPREMDEISVYFVQFLERQSVYNEIDAIVDMLIEDMKKNGFENLDNNIVESSDKKAYFTGGKKIANFDTKYDAICSFMTKNGHKWATPKEEEAVKVIFREICYYAPKYQRREALTVVNNIVAGETHTLKERMYFDELITRGYFRNRNMFEEYILYEKICKKIRRLFLKAYGSVNDDESYRLIHRICFESLYLFGDPKYSGIYIE